MILDNRGEPAWFYPVQDKRGADNYATDFKVQSYRGEPVLTWWEGRRASHHGNGGYVILDTSYREVGRIPAADGYDRDLHEFNITPQDTALITFYELVPMDLSSLGGQKNDAMYGGGVEEVDIETGEVLFRWSSLDHVGLRMSYRPLLPKPSDYFHINTIEVDHDGNLLISARNTWAVYKVDRQSGEVIWRLGGKESDFDMGPGTEFAYHHDARRHPDGTITIFDNGAAPKVHKQSRGIVLEVDEDEMRASLVREYTHPDRIISEHQGNMQELLNGNVFVGWGHQPIFSEFDSDGELLFDAAFLGTTESYRAFRFEWSGKPDTVPDVAAERASGERMTVYASWNGATEVETWQVLAGPAPDGLRPVGSAPRKGFETTISVRAVGQYVAVEAMDGSGRVLGTSEAVET